MTFLKGQSGNPGGRPKFEGEVREAIEMARQATPEAIRVLVSLLYNDDPKVQGYAANSLLDRAIGKPQQAVQLEASVAQYVLQVPQVIEATNTWMHSVRSLSGDHNPDRNLTTSPVQFSRSDLAEPEAEAKRTAR